MYVAVYAICKNEAKFVDRWVQSMSEADIIVALDTGSSDDTVEQLKQHGVYVAEKTIEPWRFDTARNLALDLVPDEADICVSTDLDEVFQPGWRAKLEAAWKPGTGQARYRYTWNFRPDGTEGVVFWQTKIHARHGYRWIHPVHEILQWIGEGAPGPIVTTSGVQLDHHADPKKSRAQYLSLLELAAKEDPDDDRCAHYLGREYMFHRRWDDCIQTLMHHLCMPKATWPDERAASMRYIALSYLQKGDRPKAQNWYLKAIAEAPYLREAYVDLAAMLYEDERWDGVLFFTECALAIENRPMSYICEEKAWGSLPNDLRSIAYFRTGRPKLARDEAEKALAIDPENIRLRANVEFLRQYQT
jgi:tetratricopeptide (TPR) repeat protein